MFTFPLTALEVTQSLTFNERRSCQRIWLHFWFPTLITWKTGIKMDLDIACM